MEIRKISVGPDYKNGAMHYIVGQKVLNDTNTIHLIRFDESAGMTDVFIINDKQEVVLWKAFNSTMPIAYEFNINF